MPKDPRYPGAQLVYDSLREVQAKLSKALRENTGSNVDFREVADEAEEEISNVLDLFAGWCGGHVTLVDIVDQPKG